MCGLALKEIGRVKKAKSRYSFNNAMKNEIFTRENFFHEISDEWVETFSKSFIHTQQKKSPFIVSFSLFFGMSQSAEEMHFL